MVDQSTTRRPNTTTAAMSTRTASRRSLASSYLDLRPLPEDVMLDATQGSIESKESNDKSSIAARSWDEEGENIRRNVLSRLPSSKSLDENEKDGTPANHAYRPSTAPILGDHSSSTSRKPFNREGLLLSSNSARSARYLAIQWRSRATQLSISTKSIGASPTTDSHSVESPPSATRVSDGSESSDSESDSEESESSHSDYSAGTMDESIKSQVSDAQKVVEKWQQRWHERSESMSFCSETASRDEEEERRTSYSAETHKAGNIAGTKSKARDQEEEVEEELPDGLEFALKPTASERALLTDKNDPVEVRSALKPYPLQPVNSGREFLSESQKKLETALEEVQEEVEAELMSESQNSVFVLNESGAVMETLDESMLTETTTDETTTTGLAFNNDNDENLSHASSSKAVENDDQLSEHSTAEQSAHVVENKGLKNDPDLSFESGKDDEKATIIQTFMETPQPIGRNSSISQDDNISMEAETPKVSHSKRKAISPKPVREAKTKPQIQPVPKSPKINALKKKNAAFTGSVQDRIDAVKRSREAVAKKKGSPKTTKSRKNRPRSSEMAKSATSLKQQTIQWQEHNVVFTFGLLTSYKDAPPSGAYSQEDEKSTSYKNKLQTRSKLLYEIMKHFGMIIHRTRSLGNGSTKYMMCSPDCVPRPVAVKRDGRFCCDILLLSSILIIFSETCSHYYIVIRQLCATNTS